MAFFSRKNSMDWETMISNPRAFRSFDSVAPIPVRFFGDGPETKLFQQHRFKDLFELMQPRAVAGDTKAQFMLAYLYDEGLGANQSDAKAFAWYEKAAAAGLPEAQNAVGVMWLNAQGTRRDIATAALWFLKAADHNDPNALCTLGSLYQQAVIGDREDKEQAVAYYIRALKAGNEGAAFNIGLMCEQHRLFELAALWYDVAFQMGCHDALGNFHGLRIRGLIPKRLFAELGLEPMLPGEF